MSDLSVAARYADALIEVAAEAGQMERVGADLRRVEALLEAHDRLLFSALASPVVTADERQAVLQAVLPRLDLHPFTANLLRVLARNRRFAAFPALRVAYDDLADARSGRARVRVSTAEPLSPQLELEIKAALEAVTGKAVLVEHTIDPSLIAGMVARVGGTVYDASLRTRLQQLQNHLVIAQA